MSALKKDRKSLEGIVRVILADKWLAGRLVGAYCEQYGYYLAPKEWMDRQLDARLAILEAVDPQQAGRIRAAVQPTPFG